jgi:hypothetical protein
LLPNKQQEGEIKMKKRTLALILGIIITLGCGGLTTIAYANNDKDEETVVVEIVKEESDTRLYIERIEEFSDVKLETYTMEELQELINIQLERQKEAHELAESARKLGWSEDSDPLTSARNE